MFRGSFLSRSVAVSLAAVIGASAFGLHSPSVAVADPSTPGASETPSPVATGSASSAEKEQVLSATQSLVDGGFPAALTAVRDKDGNTIGAAAGVGNLETGEAPPLDGEVRIGSNTKTFVAVVILQLVQEGKISLDEPIEPYLPGLLRGEGIDGTKITVRQLLQHTSGLPDHVETLFPANDTRQTGIFQLRDNYYSPRDLLDIALNKPAVFEPGSQFRYTNTNYIVLSLLVEKVTHRPLAEQITKRITEPLGLTHTYYPGPGEEDIRGQHPQGYHVNSQGELEDVTRLDPSWGGGAGAMISTPSELGTFLQATLNGTLLNQDSITEMKKTVDTGRPNRGYGLGIFSMPLSCGTAWGHTGGIHGYMTQNMVGPDGTTVTTASTALLQAIVDPSDTTAAQQKVDLMSDAVDSLMCKRQG